MTNQGGAFFLCFAIFSLATCTLSKKYHFPLFVFFEGDAGGSVQHSATFSLATFASSKK